MKTSLVHKQLIKSSIVKQIEVGNFIPEYFDNINYQLAVNRNNRIDFYYINNNNKFSFLHDYEIFANITNIKTLKSQKEDNNYNINKNSLCLLLDNNKVIIINWEILEFKIIKMFEFNNAESIYSANSNISTSSIFDYSYYHNAIFYANYKNEFFFIYNNNFYKNENKTDSASSHHILNSCIKLSYNIFNYKQIIKAYLDKSSSKINFNNEKNKGEDENNDVGIYNLHIMFKLKINCSNINNLNNVDLQNNNNNNKNNNNNNLSSELCQVSSYRITVFEKNVSENLMFINDNNESISSEVVENLEEILVPYSETAYDFIKTSHYSKNNSVIDNSSNVCSYEISFIIFCSDCIIILYNVNNVMNNIAVYSKAINIISLNTYFGNYTFNTPFKLYYENIINSTFFGNINFTNSYINQNLIINGGKVLDISTYSNIMNEAINIQLLIVSNDGKLILMQHKDISNVIQSSNNNNNNILEIKKFKIFPEVSMVYINKQEDIQSNNEYNYIVSQFGYDNNIINNISVTKSQNLDHNVVNNINLIIGGYSVDIKYVSTNLHKYVYIIEDYLLNLAPCLNFNFFLDKYKNSKYITSSGTSINGKLNFMSDKLLLSSIITLNYDNMLGEVIYLKEIHMGHVIFVYTNNCIKYYNFNCNNSNSYIDNNSSYILNNAITRNDLNYDNILFLSKIKILNGTGAEILIFFTKEIILLFNIINNNSNYMYEFINCLKIKSLIKLKLNIDISISSLNVKEIDNKHIILLINMEYVILLSLTSDNPSESMFSLIDLLSILNNNFNKINKSNANNSNYSYIENKIFKIENNTKPLIFNNNNMYFLLIFKGSNLHNDLSTICIYDISYLINNFNKSINYLNNFLLNIMYNNEDNSLNINILLNNKLVFKNFLVTELPSIMNNYSKYISSNVKDMSKSDLFYYNSDVSQCSDVNSLNDDEDDIKDFYDSLFLDSNSFQSVVPEAFLVDSYNSKLILGLISLEKRYIAIYECDLLLNNYENGLKFKKIYYEIIKSKQLIVLLNTNLNLLFKQFNNVFGYKGFFINIPQQPKIVIYNKGHIQILDIDNKNIKYQDIIECSVSIAANKSVVNGLLYFNKNNIYICDIINNYIISEYGMLKQINIDKYPFICRYFCMNEATAYQLDLIVSVEKTFIVEYVTINNLVLKNTYFKYYLNLRDEYKKYDEVELDIGDIVTEAKIIDLYDIKGNKAKVIVLGVNRIEYSNINNTNLDIEEKQDESAQLKKNINHISTAVSFLSSKLVFYNIQNSKLIKVYDSSKTIIQTDNVINANSNSLYSNGVISAIQSIGNNIIVAEGNRLVVYTFNSENKELIKLCSSPEVKTLSVCSKIRSKTILIGDINQSLSVLYLEKENIHNTSLDSLTLCGMDSNKFISSACEFYIDNNDTENNNNKIKDGFILSDYKGNVFFFLTTSESLFSKSADIHLGKRIIDFVYHKSNNEFYYYASDDGSIGIFKSINKNCFDILKNVQEYVNYNFPFRGGICPNYFYKIKYVDSFSKGRVLDLNLINLFFGLNYNYQHYVCKSNLRSISRDVVIDTYLDAEKL